MRRKIRAGPTTRKSRKTTLVAPIVAKSGSLTGSALPVDTTAIEQLRPFNIGVDLMGGDAPPPVILKALASLHATARLLAIGTAQYEKDSPIPFHVASDFITMDEAPLTAVRKKKESSLAVGLRLLKEGKIDALVSAGNTGALVTGAKMLLSTFPHILRPALLAVLPTKKGPVVVLDVGANPQIKPAHFVQFAQMGTAYARIHGIAHPKVGLLNIGSEKIKGTSERREAYSAMQTEAGENFCFVGNVESTSVFEGAVDVLITDGFTGNIFLKTAEGLASLFLDWLGANEGHLRKKLHYAEYPAALLVGVQGLVIKCHGYSTPDALVGGVRGAIQLVETEFVQKFRQQLNN